jgi:hypothetical protein
MAPSKLRTKSGYWIIRNIPYGGMQMGFSNSAEYQKIRIADTLSKRENVRKEEKSEGLAFSTCGYLVDLTQVAGYFPFPLCE